MTTDEIIVRLRSFIAENFLYMRPDFELGNDDSLMGTGIIDSMGVAEVLYLLEEEFGVVVGDDDVTEDNLGTINSIARYIKANVPATAV